MTPIDRFERGLPTALADLAAPYQPDYLIDILGRTAATRQRPVWASIERWLPVQLTTSRVPTARMPWRQLGVLAVLVIILAATVVVYAGSQQRRIPPAYGPAANGSILYTLDGDIYKADPRSGESKAIITGPEADVAPVFSLDGTQFAFARKPLANSTVGVLFVADADGSGVVQVTPESMNEPSDWSFSPDGRSIVAFVKGDQGRSIVVIPTDGSGKPKVYPVFATTGDGPAQYRPDGSEIMFIGGDPKSVNRAVYGLDPMSGRVRAIVPPSSGTMDIYGASWSPDGTRIAYGVYDTTAKAISSRTHIVNIDGTGDVVVDRHPDTIADGGFTWSNDGTRLVVTRFYSDDGSIPARSAIVPVDRSSSGVEIACPPGAPADDCSADWRWSPDDTQLIGTLESRGRTAQFLADPTTGELRAVPWTANGHPAWQRLAK